MIWGLLAALVVGFLLGLAAAFWYFGYLCDCLDRTDGDSDYPWGY